MENVKLQQLRQLYALETALLQLEALTERIKEAKWSQRSHAEKVLTYEGSFRAFLDKFSGKREDRAEELRRELRRAETALRALLREQEALKQEQDRISKERSALPSLETLQKEIAQDPSAAKEGARLEAQYCAQVLIPMLEENHRALLELRRLMGGGRAGEIISIEEQQAIHAGPNIWGEKCVPLLQRLKSALEIQDIPFEIGSYYRAPTSFIVSAAAVHNRRDRVNQAMDQVLAAKKQIAAILAECSEDNR